MPADPAGASHLADEVYAQIRTTIADIRRLVYGLRPPTLDDLGLAGAIREAGRPASQDALELTIAADGDLTGLPDDGAGIPPDHPSGIGLLAMRERAAELGGTFHIDSTSGHGTRLTARLPLTPQENADGPTARTDS